VENLYELRLNSAIRKSWTTYRNRTYGADGPANLARNAAKDQGPIRDADVACPSTAE
jgi:hypothetical protein